MKGFIKKYKSILALIGGCFGSASVWGMEDSFQLAAHLDRKFEGWPGPGYYQGYRPSLETQKEIPQDILSEKEQLQATFQVSLALAKKGDLNASCELGKFYYKGAIFPDRVLEKNLAAAILWWKKGCEKNHPESLYQLGKCLKKLDADGQKNFFVPWDFNTLFSNSFKSLFQKGKRRTPSEEYRLGKCYEYEVGCLKDVTKSLSCYQKAARHGHEKAQKKINQVFAFVESEELRLFRETTKEKSNIWVLRERLMKIQDANSKSCKKDS